MAIAINNLNALIANLNNAIDGKLSEEATDKAINEACKALDKHHRCDRWPFWPYAWERAIEATSLEERREGMHSILDHLFDLYSEDQEALLSLLEIERMRVLPPL